MNTAIGRIFDMLRASVNDGPGIRTTVFFKGCPLRCKWCHNPESWSPAQQLFFNRDRCIRCMACAAVCPREAHRSAEGGHEVDFTRCAACGECVKGCPGGALKLMGREADMESLLQEILRDKEYYDLSGGGVTLSGGEPMLQPEAALSLLRLCREHGVHTCVETCGHAPQGSYRQILPYTDLFLFDYKCTGAKEHKRWTGVDSTLILANLEYLYAQGASIILRCPVVPGVNDTEAHFRAIAEMERRYPRLCGIEIMPYHSMGVSKGTGVGLVMELANLKTVDEEIKASWRSRLAGHGARRAVIR